MANEAKHGPNCRAWAVGRVDGTSDSGWHCGPGCPSRGDGEVQVGVAAEQAPPEFDLDAIEGKARQVRDIAEHIGMLERAGERPQVWEGVT